MYDLYVRNNFGARAKSNILLKANIVTTTTKSIRAVGRHCSQDVYLSTPLTHTGVCESSFAVILTQLIHQVDILCRLWKPGFAT